MPLLTNVVPVAEKLGNPAQGAWNPGEPGNIQPRKEPGMSGLEKPGRGD